MNTLFIALILSTALAQRAPATLAQELFASLAVRTVPCPAYTRNGSNEPVCGITEASPRAFTQAFSKAVEGKLEPEGPWAEDHSVWLRYYRDGDVRYAAIYTRLAETFNVQFVRLK